MSDERSKEPTGESSKTTTAAASSSGTTPGAGSSTTQSAPDETAVAPRMDLPAWGQGKSKRRRQAPPTEGEQAVQEGLASFEAVDRGVAKVGRPMFNNVFLVVGGLIAVAGLVAGVQYMQGQNEGEIAASTRVLAKGLAPMARGRVVPEGEEIPEVANDPLARTRAELQDQAKTALQSAVASEGQGGASAKLARASLAMRQGDAKAAAQGYADFLASADPKHPMRNAAIEGHALALEQSGDLEGALKKLDELPASDSVRHAWHRGRILLALGRKDEAKTQLEKASSKPQAGLEAKLAKSMLGKIGKNGAAAGSTP